MVTSKTSGALTVEAPQTWKPPPARMYVPCASVTFAFAAVVMSQVPHLPPDATPMQIPP